MRVIKFRGLSDHNMSYVGDLIHHNDRISIRPFDDFDYPFGHVVKPDSICQFTGFFDHFGKEIFEGDSLVRWSPYDLDDPDLTIYTASWFDGGWCVMSDGNLEEYLTSVTSHFFTIV